MKKQYGYYIWGILGRLSSGCGLQGARRQGGMQGGLTGTGGSYKIERYRFFIMMRGWKKWGPEKMGCIKENKGGRRK